MTDESSGIWITWEMVSVVTMVLVAVGGLVTVYLKIYVSSVSNASKNDILQAINDKFIQQDLAKIQFDTIKHDIDRIENTVRGLERDRLRRDS